MSRIVINVVIKTVLVYCYFTNKLFQHQIICFPIVLNLGERDNVTIYQSMLFEIQMTIRKEECQNVKIEQRKKCLDELEHLKYVKVWK